MGPVVGDGAGLVDILDNLNKWILSGNSAIGKEVKMLEVKASLK